MATHEVFDRLQAGIQLQKNNQLDEAEQIYRSILNDYPNHPDALHLLGVIAYQVGEYSVAEDLISKAIAANYQVADYHNNLGEVYRATNRSDQAGEQYQMALDIDPGHTNARNNLTKLQAGDTAPSTADTGEGILIPEVRHALPSYIFSLDDEPYQPNRKLVEVSLAAGLDAIQIDLSSLATHFPPETGNMINVWPGEHYRFLAALVKVTQPRLVIEIGTATGASALAMKKFLQDDARIVTYDVVPWNEYPGTGLSERDLDRQLEQRIVDLSDTNQAQGEIPLLEQADLIFVDAAKDVIMEQQFCNLFDSINFRSNPIMIFDDIRVMNMLKIWREIQHPKLDITSYGHWSGTGMVDWTA
jgi:predicted O-methyltransferase YrrM